LVNILKKPPKAIQLKYVIQTRRLSIDEHMLEVKNLASGDYIYYLGDDDFFISDQLPLLLNLIKTEAPDLAIFNGKLINQHGKLIGRHFELKPQIFSNIQKAYVSLRDKGSYGSILVKACHLKDFYFKALFGTSHAYGCYWFSILECGLKGNSLKITVPEFPLVVLRVNDKLYKHTEVYYRDIPYEISVYKRYLPQGEAQKLNDLFCARYIGSITRIRFLLMLAYYGSSLDEIKNINYSLYKKIYIKILLAKILTKLNIYGTGKSFREILKRFL